jgi:hypothetical protein
MLSAHVVRFGLTNFVGKTSMRQTAVLFSKPNAYNATFRQLSNQTRNSFTRRTTKSRTLKEIVTAPAGEGGNHYIWRLFKLHSF